MNVKELRKFLVVQWHHPVAWLDDKDDVIVVDLDFVPPPIVSAHDIPPIADTNLRYAGFVGLLFAIVVDVVEDSAASRLGGRLISLFNHRFMRMDEDNLKNEANQDS